MYFFERTNTTLMVLNAFLYLVAGTNNAQVKNWTALCVETNVNSHAVFNKWHISHSVTVKHQNVVGACPVKM